MKFTLNVFYLVNDFFLLCCCCCLRLKVKENWSTTSIIWGWIGVEWRYERFSAFKTSSTHISISLDGLRRVEENRSAEAWEDYGCAIKVHVYCNYWFICSAVNICMNWKWRLFQLRSMANTTIWRDFDKLCWWILMNREMRVEAHSVGLYDRSVYNIN